MLLTLVAKPKVQIVSHKSSSFGRIWTSINVLESHPVNVRKKKDELRDLGSWNKKGTIVLHLFGIMLLT